LFLSSRNWGEKLSGLPWATGAGKSSPGPGLKISSPAPFVKPGRPGNKRGPRLGELCRGSSPLGYSRRFPSLLQPGGAPKKKSPVRGSRTGDHMWNPSRWGLTGKPAVVAHREEGVGLDPVEEEEGKVGVDDTVNEFHIPLLMDVVVHPHQGENPQPGEEFHHDDGIDEKGKQQHPQKEVGERELDLSNEEVDNGQKPVLFPVVAKDEPELHPG